MDEMISMNDELLDENEELREKLNKLEKLLIGSMNKSAEEKSETG